MHPGAYWFVHDTTTRFGPFRRVLEIGSYNVNGTVRPLFGDAAYVGVDKRPGRDVDVVADAHDYQCALQPDCVVCCEVLEHDPNPEHIVKRMIEWLIPGGRLIVTAASPERAPHGIDGNAVAEGEHYGNIAPTDLVHWVRAAKMENVECVHAPTLGDVYIRCTKPVLAAKIASLAGTRVQAAGKVN